MPEKSLYPFHLFRAAKLMVVRRNDRRRRLLNDEFVPTIEPDRPSKKADLHHAAEDTCGTRRTYASGADRRNQLRTTDLFPKRTWLIVTFGLLLVSLIVAINGLAWNAESWRSVIGPEGVAALQLRGTGTLAGWFTCFLMVSVALVSLQIYAMRRHRCDDYVGRYRMWMWFPPVFVIASFASIVDVASIARNIFDSTLGLSLPAGSLVPFIVALVILAALAGRVLYEVKESRASVAILVLAWLSLAISIVMQTEWAGNQIADFDRQLVLGNSYLVSAVALLIGHLFYTRFVYLHAHGLIVKRQPKVATKASKRVASKESARSSRKPVPPAAKAAKTSKPSKAGDAATNNADAKQVAAKQVAAKKATTKQAAAKRGSTKSPAKVASVKTPTATTKTSAPAPAAEPKPTTMNSFKSLMEKRKSDQQVAASAKAEAVAESDPPATLKMSKAERRRARKANRSSRKAA